MHLETADGPVEITEETIQCLQTKYPTKAVADELAKMHLWLLAHPKRRPKGLWRFMDHWLSPSRATGPERIRSNYQSATVSPSVQRRENLANLCGWNREPASKRVAAADIRPDDGDLFRVEDDRRLGWRP